MSLSGVSSKPLFLFFVVLFVLCLCVGMDGIPNTQHLINFEFTAPLIQLKEKEVDGGMSLFATFPNGPTPLCLNPTFTFGEACG